MKFQNGIFRTPGAGTGPCQAQGRHGGLLRANRTPQGHGGSKVGDGPLPTPPTQVRGLENKINSPFELGQEGTYHAPRLSFAKMISTRPLPTPPRPLPGRGQTNHQPDPVTPPRPYKGEGSRVSWCAREAGSEKSSRSGRGRGSGEGSGS